MALQGEYEPSPSTWVRDQVDLYERTDGAEGNTIMDRPVVVITSRGAKSGKLRKNPVMRVEHNGVYAAVASKGGAPEHPSWFHNFVAHPQVDLQDGAEKHDPGLPAGAGLRGRRGDRFACSHQHHVTSPPVTSA